MKRLLALASPLLLVPFITPTIVPSVSKAEAENRRIRLDSSNTIRLNYGFPAWNKSPLEIDTASLLMREGSTGRIVQIGLQETAPDSSVFSGVYSINWENLKTLQVEFYIPPNQELLGSAEGLRKITSMIESKQLGRRPFLLRRTLDGSQNIEIFDTREQARTALNAYRAEQQIETLQNKKFPTDQEVDTAILAEELKEREAAARGLAERARLGQVEASRLQDLINKYYAATPAERTARKKQAEKLAAEAMTFYGQDQFAEALSKFDEAVSLDPTNRSYYYQYGVTLYRNDQLNRSIVYLELSENSDVNPAERAYFLGLNFYQLKEYTNAANSFDQVISAKDPQLAPSAQFYKGIIKYDQKQWKEAQDAFQAVLDTSKDPRLDERAEAYIEQILRLRQYETERSRKWQFALTVGGMYDSNVILSADSARDTGLASDVEGYRGLLSGSVRYRPIYEEKKEFAAQLDLLTMYTMDNSFQVDDDLRAADPTMATLTLPWTYKGLMFNKGYKLDITPGYETIFMSIENNENKEILHSYLLNFSNLFVMNNRWYANYNLELRKDESQLDASTGDNDSSALKIKLINSNLVFLGDKTKILILDGAFTMNQALGSQVAYDRIDLGVGYLQPWKWSTTVNFKLNYFYLTYPQHNEGRIDNSYTLSAGLNKKLNETWSTGFLASYNINNSNISANQYQKGMALLTLSALWGQ